MPSERAVLHVAAGKLPERLDDGASFHFFQRLSIGIGCLAFLPVRFDIGCGSLQP